MSQEVKVSSCEGGGDFYPEGIRCSSLKPLDLWGGAVAGLGGFFPARVGGAAAGLAG